MLFLGLAPTRRPVAPRSGSPHMASDELSELLLLPSSSTQLVLPGERRRLLFREPDEMEMLSHSVTNNDGKFGQMISTESQAETVAEQRAGSEERMRMRMSFAAAGLPQQVEPWVALLQVMEVRRFNHDDALAIEVKGVGRAALESVPARVCRPDGVLRAAASFVGDELLSSEPNSSALSQFLDLAEHMERVEEELDACRALEGQLLLEPESCARFDVPLREQVQTGRTALLQRGLDEAPAVMLMEQLQPVWHTSCDIEAEAQLQSWAACACLGGEARLAAFRLRSTPARAALAHRELRRLRAYLETEQRLERELRR